MGVHENLEMGDFIMTNHSLFNTNIKKVYEKFPILKEKQACRSFSLSGSRQQRLFITRDLMQNPKLLLLDGHSLSLSSKATNEVFNIIKS